MIAVEEAQRIVLNHLYTYKSEEVCIEKAIGRVLDEDIVADRDFPPFNRVMMDGIAINHKTWNKGVRKFKIEGMQAAGVSQKTLENDLNCIEVMTGAVLPQNADAVIRYEDLTFEEDAYAKVKATEVELFQHVHLTGTDRKRREVLVEAGRVVSSAEIAVMATVGKITVKVKSLPKIAIVSTGDELVEIDEEPRPYQIRKSNSYALQASLRQLGYSSKSYHLSDDKQGIQKGLTDIFEDHDLIILSGGVSKGKKDYVPEVLDALKVQKAFHRVAQRPGKPFWFGNRADGKTVFALPGNPVSTFMCFYRYIKPWLMASHGVKVLQEKAALTEEFDFTPDLTFFLQVKVNISEEGQLQAEPVKGQGSGDLANLLDADAFLELPADLHHFKKGDVYPLIRYR